MCVVFFTLIRQIEWGVLMIHPSWGNLNAPMRTEQFLSESTPTTTDKQTIYLQVIVMQTSVSDADEKW